MSERDAVIVDAVRTPVGKRNGSLAKIHAVDLSAHVLNALVARNGFDPAVVDELDQARAAVWQRDRGPMGE